MTHITEHCEKKLLKQPRSIGALIFAEKYRLTELREVCLEYAKSTPLETVKRDELYDQIESGTKVEILEHNLGTLAKEAGDANEALKDIQRLAASLTCPDSYGYGKCACSKCKALTQIKEIIATQCIIQPKGP